MNLLTALVKLRELLEAETPDVDGVAALLRANDRWAEFEVARSYVSRRLGPFVRTLARSEDPRQRRRAVDLIQQTFGRAEAGVHLRRLVKDPDSGVRSRAQNAVVRLKLDDVSLPRRQGGATRGPWGWLHGLEGVSSKRAPGLDGLGLPALSDADDVAALVGVDSLTPLLRPGSQSGAPYVDFEVPKARGGTRTISAPRPELRRVQRVLLRELLDKLPVHDAAHGFVKGRSTLTNATPHAGAAILIKLDLEDFFPSIHYRRVEGLFRHYGYADEAAKALAGLCTRRPKLADGRVAWPGVLPQGAPTSPAIANLVARRLDERLSGLAAKVGATYTRYADDLTFSFPKPADGSSPEPDKGIGRFLWWVDQICQQEGFTEKPSKRRVLRAGTQQRVTGLVVNETPAIPRAARRRFRAILHNCERHGVASQAREHPNFPEYLRGFAAYAHMVHPELGAEWRARVDALLG